MVIKLDCQRLSKFLKEGLFFELLKHFPQQKTAISVSKILHAG